MNLKFTRIFLTTTLLLCASLIFAQVTTSGLNGKVTGDKGETLPGATVVALHQPTGAQFGTTTDLNGFYRLPNLTVGGPYLVTISFIGYEPYKKDGIYLTLGQTLKISASISEKASTLMGVEVVAVRNDIFDGNRTGSETNISRDQIEKMPTVSRNLTDFTRMTPQVKLQETSDGPNLSVAGMNNRFNAVFIDGAVNNDVFGLAGSGTNGGQTGMSPFSMDVIEQFNVSIAPYDVKLGGFAGAGINAITRRGTNEWEGSAYYYMRNQDLAGKTPTDDASATKSKLPDFTAKTMGVRIGGPIVKDKLFFFANVELQKDETPNPFDFSTYEGNSTEADLGALITKLAGYGYDPGSYKGVIKELEGTKIFGRLDYNLSKNHKLTVRHQYSKGIKTDPSYQSKTRLTFENSGQYFPSVTNSSAIELKSIIGNKYANNLIIGYTKVDDDRDPMKNPFPYVSIKDGKGSIEFGSEQFSTANALKQNILTLTDNFDWYMGKHSLTIGTHNELYDMYNLFIRQNFGVYSYNSLTDFMTDLPAYRYDRSFSLVDNITGDGSAAAAEFKALQLAFYLQDEYQALDNLKFTAGFRVDIPMFLDDPAANSDFNENMIPILEAAGQDLMGATSGAMPDAKPLLSPRMGFNWDVFNNQKTQLRGGMGIFTSRIPYVWPGGAYINNGITLGGMRITDATDPRMIFNPDWQNQPSLEPDKPSGQIDLFAKNFKFPQVFRASIAVDQKLPYGIIGTFDLTYTKNKNNVMYQNLRYVKSGKTLTGTGDDRPIWERVDIGSAKYTDFMLASNTSRGEAYNITLQLEKRFNKAFNTSLAYTYGHSTSMNDGQSSQNSSQWRVPNVRGKNDIDLATSDYALGHRVVGFMSYKVEYLKHFGTTIGLYYNGQSGQLYSYGYADGGSKFLGEDNQALELMYVPLNQNDIHFNPIKDKDGNITVTEEAQWTALNNFIENDPYLSTRRGMYAERNSSRTPFEHNFDLHIAQDFYINVAGKRNTLQLTFDIFNLGNLISSDFGRKYYVSSYYGNYPLVNFNGFDADGTTPKFQFTAPKGEVWSIDDSGLMSSRWQGQIGIRYIFN